MLIKKEHLVDGFEVKGYGWEHFKRMYNLHSRVEGLNDFIDDGTFDWESHVKFFNKNKKINKKVPGNNTKISDIKKWLKSKKVPLNGAKTKEELLELVEVNK